jgi:glycosyltransferase involved in cell wall biosynthesis
MRITHVCFCGPFTDGLSYQENELIEQHVALGHDVTVLASIETYSGDKQIVQTNPGRYKLRCGATLIRLPYARFLMGWLATKLRASRGLTDCLEEIRPDRILFHGLTAWDLLAVTAYASRNSGVKLFADCHEDFNNSARTWTSRELLHKLFYKPIFQRCVDQIHEVLCITVESLDFAVDFYGSPRSKTRLYPMGCTIEPSAVVDQRRVDFRARFGFSNSDIVITQTGKLDKTKRLASALQAFGANPSPALRLVIAGRMSDDVKDECLPLIQSDPRIVDLGWQSTDELRSVLAGADCFLQPFGQTVTTQMAMGYGCVILAQDKPSHRWLVGDNGSLFNDASELGDTFQWVLKNQARLDELKMANSKFAAAQFDYKQLALQILN